MYKPELSKQARDKLSLNLLLAKPFNCSQKREKATKQTNEWPSEKEAQTHKNAAYIHRSRKELCIYLKYVDRSTEISHPSGAL